MAEHTLKVRSIDSQDGFKQHSSSLPPSALLVLYFHTPWAAPCKQMSTVLDALASTYPVTSPSTIAFLSIDAEDVPDLAEAHDVTVVPYFVLQRDGKTVETVSGADPSKIRAAVEKHGPKTSSASAVGLDLPPAQTMAEKPRDQSSAGGGEASQEKATENGDTTKVTKDLSSYAPPANGHPPNAADSSSSTTGEPDKAAVIKRLDGLVKAAPVMLFMKGTPSAPQCGFSRQTVALLRERSIRYGFFNILADDDVRQGLKEYADWPTFPQLWVDGELIGGLDIVREEFGNNPEFLMEYSANSQKSGSAESTSQSVPQVA